MSVLRWPRRPRHQALAIPSERCPAFDEGIRFTHPDPDANVWTNQFDPVDGIDNDVTTVDLGVPGVTSTRRCRLTLTKYGAYSGTSMATPHVAAGRTRDRRRPAGADATSDPKST